MRLYRHALLVSLVLALPLAAEEDGLTRVELRVASIGAGVVVVDRGARDKVAVGDRVLLRPRGGATHSGTVVEVSERSAVVELVDGNLLPPAGTRGEVLIPSSRFEAEEESGPEAESEPLPDEHPPWENRDEDYRKNKPLLSGMRPVRPDQRTKRISGRAYAIANFVQDVRGTFSNSVLRFGTDLVMSNPFRKGGEFRFNGEFDYLTKTLEKDLEPDILIRRLSYRRGGDRFSPDRWEFGRFLQQGMPEFGLLDGAEWTRRKANGHRFGFSAGFMPEFEDSFNSLQDAQIAGFYEWVSDTSEQLMLGAGFQKTWNDFTADRDLLVAKVRYDPPGGLHVFATVWIDFYTGSDDLKNSAVEVTEAIASVRKTWKSDNGVEAIYTYRAFPDIRRNGEFLPPLPAEITGNTYHRLALNGWRWLTAKLQIHGHLSGWVDEDRCGGAVDLGIEINDIVARGVRGDLTVFGARGQFENQYGVRASLGQFADKGHWEIFYEISNNRRFGFPNDRDDIIQHRARISSGYLAAPWNFSVFIEVANFDAEISWAVGLNVERNF